MSDTIERSWTYREASAVTGLPVSALKTSVECGELDAIRIMDAVFIPKRAIDPFMAKLGLSKPPNRTRRAKT